MIVDRRRGAAILAAESLRPLVALAAWDLLVVGVFQLAHRPWMDQPALPVSLIGSAIALLVGIRNANAYARWWEARTLWGAVVNQCRSLGRQLRTLTGRQIGPDDRASLVRAVAAFPHALRASLVAVPETAPGAASDAAARAAVLLGPARAQAVAGFRNRPRAILDAIAADVAILADGLALDGAIHAAIDRTCSALTDAQGGLERIRNTPLPVQFSVLPRLLIGLFCAVLPFSMVQELGWITPLGSTAVSFLFLALEAVGAELQDPFAASPHALPMRAMATTIEIDLLQSIGAPPPEPAAPVRGVLD